MTPLHLFLLLVVLHICVTETLGRLRDIVVKPPPPPPQSPPSSSPTGTAGSKRMEGCPTYKNVSAVNKNFSMSLLQGTWYVIATNEPTIPSFAKSCGLLNFTVYAGGAYRYWSTSEAIIGGTRNNFTVGPIGGTCAYSNKRETGDCMENIAPFNRSINGILVPNMFFNYSSGSTTNKLGFSANNNPEWYMSYACVARMFGKNIFSFFLSARSPFVSRAWVDQKIDWVRRQGLNLDGLVIADVTVWKKTCWNEH